MQGSAAQNEASFSGAAPGAISFNKDQLLNNNINNLLSKLDEAQQTKSGLKPAMLVEMQKRMTQLSEQNAHLNNYILELVKENEILQSKLNDMRVNLQENKQMLTDFINQQSQNQTNLKLELNSTLVNPLHEEIKMSMPLKDQYQTVQAKSDKLNIAAAAPDV